VPNKDRKCATPKQREQLFHLRLISALLGHGRQTDNFTVQTVTLPICVRASFHDLNSLLCKTGEKGRFIIQHLQ